MLDKFKTIYRKSRLFLFFFLFIFSSSSSSFDKVHVLFTWAKHLTIHTLDSTYMRNRMGIKMNKNERRRRKNTNTLARTHFNWTESKPSVSGVLRKWWVCLRACGCDEKRKMCFHQIGIFKLDSNPNTHIQKQKIKTKQINNLMLLNCLKIKMKSN